MRLDGFICADDGGTDRRLDEPVSDCMRARSISESPPNLDASMFMPPFPLFMLPLLFALLLLLLFPLPLLLLLPTLFAVLAKLCSWLI